MNKKFYCYSTTLLYFLKYNGLKYEYQTTHCKTGKKIWIFARTDRLSELLDEYDRNKKRARDEGII